MNIINTLFYICFIINIAFPVYAELAIESVYPTLFKSGQLTELRITGKGFNEKTRVSIIPDSGNNRALICAMDTPGLTYSISKSGNLLFIADGSNGVQLMSISKNKELSLISHYDTPGTAMDIDVIGSTAFVADGKTGLLIIDVKKPLNPELVHTIDVSSEATGISISGNTLCLTTSDKGICIFDISVPHKAISMDDCISIGANTVSGMCEAVLYSNYVLAANIGNGLVIINTAETNNAPIQMTNISGSVQSIKINQKRAFVTTFESKLYIIDLTEIMQPVLISSCKTNNVGQDMLVQDDIVYVATRFNGIEKIDISQIETPNHLAFVSTPGNARKLIIDNDILYVADTYGIRLIDMTKISSSGILSRLSVPDGKFDALDIMFNSSNNQKNLAYIADRFDYSDYDRLHIIDISNPFQPEIISTTDVPRNLFDIAVSDQAAYLASDNAILVFDISHPENPILTKQLSFNSKVYCVEIEDDKAYIGLLSTEPDESFYIYDISNPLSPTEHNSLPLRGVCNDMKVINSVLFYVGTISNPPWNTPIGLITINVQPQDNNINILGSYKINNASYVSVKNSIAYVSDYQNVHILDVSIPDSISKVKTIPTDDRPKKISVNDQIACVALNNTGLLILDIQDSHSSQVIGQIDLPGMMMDVQVQKNIAYATCNSGGFAIASLPYEFINKTIEDSFHIFVSSFPFPDVDGHYTVRVFNDEDEYQIPGAISFVNDNRKLKAIIVSAANKDIYLKNAFENCAISAYNTLLYQGYLKENIYFIGPDTTKDIDKNGKADDINYTPTTANLFYSIDEWAQDAQDLLIYMVGHGYTKVNSDEIEGYYVINSEESISASVLDEKLDTLQYKRKQLSILMIFDTCYSESFMKSLIPPENTSRIIITSSSKKATFHSRGLQSFSFVFWNRLLIDGNVFNTFKSVRELYQCSETQIPAIDANGNGYPNEDADIRSLKTLNPVIGRASDINPDIPHIEMISGEQNLYGQTCAEIYAGKIQSKSDIVSVLAYINISGEEPDKQPLELEDKNNDGTYRGVYSGFYQKGTYQINIYAVNKNNRYSLPKSTQIIQHVPAGDINNDQLINLPDVIHLMKKIGEK